MKRGYDAIAGVYDWLAKIFIGKALREAQTDLLQYIPAGASVLIAGGGTGWILEEIAKVHKEGLQMDYLDISAKMIVKAKKQDIQRNNIRFLNQSADNDFNGDNYDIILTPFFFDNFKEATMQRIFKKLHPKLKQQGLWLYADFQVEGKHKLFQRSILLLMYTFFRTVCNIEADHLPDVERQFMENGYKLLCSRTFKQDFIVNAVYKKGQPV